MSKVNNKDTGRLNDVVLVFLLLTLKIFYTLPYSVLLLILNKGIPTGKKPRRRCYADPKVTTLVFDRLFKIGQSAHLF